MVAVVSVYNFPATLEAGGACAVRLVHKRRRRCRAKLVLSHDARGNCVCASQLLEACGSLFLDRQLFGTNARRCVWDVVPLRVSERVHQGGLTCSVRGGELRATSHRRASHASRDSTDDGCNVT